MSEWLLCTQFCTFKWGIASQEETYFVKKYPSWKDFKMLFYGVGITQPTVILNYQFKPLQPKSCCTAPLNMMLYYKCQLCQLKNFEGLKSMVYSTTVLYGIVKRVNVSLGHIVLMYTKQWIYLNIVILTYSYSLVYRTGWRPLLHLQYCRYGQTLHQWYGMSPFKNHKTKETLKD
jgi:hypothetical protein